MIILKLNSFLQVIGFLFAAKAVFGVLNLFLDWQVTIAGWVLPMWLTVVAVVADALLASAAFQFAKKK